MATTGSESGPQRRKELHRLLQTSRDDCLRRLRSKMADVRAHKLDRRVGFEDASHACEDECDTDIAILQMESEIVKKIDLAMSRLEQGTYGDCIVCGDPIAPKRLHAMPFASRCRDCEESSESAPRHGFQLAASVNRNYPTDC